VSSVTHRYDISADVLSGQCIRRFGTFIGNPDRKA